MRLGYTHLGLLVTTFLTVFHSSNAAALFTFSGGVSTQPTYMLPNDSVTIFCEDTVDNQCLSNIVRTDGDMSLNCTDATGVFDDTERSYSCGLTGFDCGPVTFDPGSGTPLEFNIACVGNKYDIGTVQLGVNAVTSYTFNPADLECDWSVVTAVINAYDEDDKLVGVAEIDEGNIEFPVLPAGSYYLRPSGVTSCLNGGVTTRYVNLEIAFQTGFSLQYKVVKDNFVIFDSAIDDLADFYLTDEDIDVKYYSADYSVLDGVDGYVSEAGGVILSKTFASPADDVDISIPADTFTDGAFSNYALSAVLNFGHVLSVPEFISSNVGASEEFVVCDDADADADVQAAFEATTLGAWYDFTHDGSKLDFVSKTDVIAPPGSYEVVIPGNTFSCGGTPNAPIDVTISIGYEFEATAYYNGEEVALTELADAGDSVVRLAYAAPDASFLPALLHQLKALPTATGFAGPTGSYTAYVEGNSVVAEWVTDAPADITIPEKTVCAGDSLCNAAQVVELATISQPPVVCELGVDEPKINNAEYLCDSDEHVTNKKFVELVFDVTDCTIDPEEVYNSFVESVTLNDEPVLGAIVFVGDGACSGNEATISLDISGLPDGVYTFDLVSGALTTKLRIDRTPPAVTNMTYSGPVVLAGQGFPAGQNVPAAMFSDNFTSGGKLKVQFIDSSETGIVLHSTDPVDGWHTLADASLVSTFGLVQYPIGTYTYTVKAKDEAGNVAEGTFRIPVVAPAKCVLTVSDERKLQSRDTLLSSSSVFTVTADFDVPVAGVKAESLECTLFGVPCNTVAKLSTSSSSRRYTWTFSNGFTPEIKDADVLKFALSMDGISVAANNYPVIAPSPVQVRVDKRRPALYVKFRSPYYAVKSVPYTLVLPKTLFYDTVSPADKIRVVSSTKPLQLGLSFVSGFQGIAKIAGVVPATVNGEDKILSYDLTAEDQALNRVLANDAVSIRVKADRDPVIINNTDKSVLKVTSVAAPVPVFPSFNSNIDPSVTKVRVFLIYSEADEEIVVCPNPGASFRDPETNIHYCEINAPDKDHIKGITYEHDQNLHVHPGIRTVRVDFLDADEAVIASFSRNLQVAIPNKAPVVTLDDTSCTPDITWDESNPVATDVFCEVDIADGDDSDFSGARVSIIPDDNTGSCDPERDFLRLPGNYIPEPKVYGVWSASHCTLSLRSLSSTNLISNEDLVTALEAVQYLNLDENNPTPGHDCSVTPAPDACKRTISIVVEDNGSDGANAKSLSDVSLDSTVVLTLVSVDTPPVIDQRIAYSRGGFLSSDNLFAYTDVVQPIADFKYDETVTHYRFVVSTEDTDTHTIQFNLSNDEELPKGVFANGAIVYLDFYKDRVTAVEVECGGNVLESGTIGDIDGLQISLGPINPTTAGNHDCVFTVDTVAIPFGIDVRTPDCPFDTAVEDTSDSTIHYRNYPVNTAANTYPSLSECDFDSVSVRSDADSKEINIFYEGKEVLDNVFQELQSLKVSLVAQIAGLSTLRNAARGFFSILIPRYALFSRQSMDFEYEFADISTIKLPPLPTGASSADLDIALRMSPAGTSFSSNVRVCIFVGDTDPNFTRVLAVTSQKDVTDETKGYMDYEILANQSFNIATGELCASTKHFSIFVPIAFPVSTAPEVPKHHLMGGSCPNACSGQGTCRQEGQCVCFAGFEGYDCSMRVCPTAPSWGEDQTVMHSQSECAGRGMCDRSTGQCECFDGYEGGACERIKCPNSCSNNGKCRLLSELPEVRQAEYNSWEIDRIQVCVCDGGWTGADCSQRVCPFGDDPETVCAYNERQVQKVTLEFQSQLGTGIVYNDEFILGFTTLDGSTFWTPMIEDFFTGNPEGVETALKSLPQYAIDDVDVSLETATATTVEYHVTMSGRTLTGDQNLFLCPTNVDGSYGCVAPGCRPKFKQLFYMSYSTHADNLVSDNMILSTPYPGAVVKTTLHITDDGTYYFKETYVDADPAPEFNTEETVLPPVGLRNFLEGPYGLLLDLSEVDTSMETQYSYEWTLPTCTVEVVQDADPDLEALECANRGICNRDTGQCECFTGYAGYNCAQQTVYV